MFILVNPNTNVLINIAEKCTPIVINNGENIECEEEKATSYLMDNGLIYPKNLPVKMYELDSIPEDIEAYKYLYIDGEFINNENYTEDININLQNFKNELYKVLSDINKLDENNVKTNISKILNTYLYLGEDIYYLNDSGNARFNELRAFHILKLGESGSGYYLDNTGKGVLDNINSKIISSNTINTNVINIEDKINLGNNDIYYIDSNGNSNLSIVSLNDIMIKNKIKIGESDTYYIDKNADCKLSSIETDDINTVNMIFEEAVGNTLDICTIESTSFTIIKKFDTSYYPIVESLGAANHITSFGWDGNSRYGQYDTVTNIKGKTINIVAGSELNISTNTGSIKLNNTTFKSDVYFADGTDYYIDKDGNTKFKTITVDDSPTFGGNSTFKDNVYFADGTDYYVDKDGNAKFKDIILDGSSIIRGDSNIAGNLSLNGTAVIDGDSTFKNNVYFANSTDYYIDKDGNTKFKSIIIDNIAENLTVDGTITIDGDSIFNSDLYFAGGTDYYIDIEGNTKLKTIIADGDTDIAGNLSLNGTAVIDGDSTFKNNVYFANGTDYYISNNGDAKFKSIIVEGSPTFNNDSNFNDDVYFASGTNYYIDKDGNSKFKTIIIDGDNTTNGNTDITGNLTVDGTSIFGSNSTFNSDVYFAGSNDYYIDKDGNSKFKSAIIDSNTDIEGNLTVDGICTFNDDTNITGNFVVDGNTDITGYLKIDGDSTFKNNVYFANGTDYYISNNGDAKFKSIIVDTNSNIKGSLTVDGDSTFNNNVYFAGNSDYYINNNGAANFNSITQDGNDVLDTSNYTLYCATYDHTHNYAGSTTPDGPATTALECTGNSASATILQTARTINGTNFDGSTDITTANWGTARTITIGNTGKSVNGSDNVSWSLSEIGAAAASHTHNYAGSSSAGGAATTALACTGNAATATILQTARTINGTSFNGSGNITTANWGTARTITIGNKGKSVNGSGNVSWSLSEIGAAASSHTHSYLPLSGGTLTGTLTVNNTLYTNGNSSNTQAIVLPNSKYIHAKSTNATVCSILGISSSNNVFLGYSGTDGALNNTNIYAGGYVRMYSNQNDSVKGQGVELYREGNQTGGIYREIFCSNTNATHWLGVSSKRWNTGFFTNSITASDLKEKSIIKDFDFKTKDFIMGLEPIAYRRIGAGDSGERIHLGLGAQTLAKHINDLEIGNLSMVQASIINDDGEESPYYGEEIDDSKLSWGINYTELIPQLIKMVQEQQKEIDELKAMINK